MGAAHLAGSRRKEGALNFVRSGECRNDTLKERAVGLRKAPMPPSKTEAVMRALQACSKPVIDLKRVLLGPLSGPAGRPWEAAANGL